MQYRKQAFRCYLVVVTHNSEGCLHQLKKVHNCYKCFELLVTFSSSTDATGLFQIFELDMKYHKSMKALANGVLNKPELLMSCTIHHAIIITFHELLKI